MIHPVETELLTSAQRARPCPASGCTQWAFRASDHDIIELERWIWSCGGGHHGPRVVGGRYEDGTA